MRTAEHAPRDPFNFLERRHGLAKIVDSGGGVSAERVRVMAPHPERDLVILSEDASRRGDRFAQQSLNFFEALETKKRHRQVGGCQ